MLIVHSMVDCCSYLNSKKKKKKKRKKERKKKIFEYKIFINLSVDPKLK